MYGIFRTPTYIYLHLPYKLTLINVGKYANRPMDASWVLEFKKTLLRWTRCHSARDLENGPLVDYWP